MALTKLDTSNRELGKLAYHLRQAIDLFRIIGLNVKALRRRGVAIGFFAQVYSMAHESIAVTICKIFEPEKDFELNSIAGVIRLLGRRRYTAVQIKDVERFGGKYGNPNACTDPAAFLAQTGELFQKRHETSLRLLRQFRNKFSTHSEFGFKLGPLPSHDDFEDLFQFANDFYRLVSESVNGAGPALMSSRAGPSLIRLLTEIGIESPKYHFSR